MHLKLRAQLAQRLLTPDCFHRHPRFERRTVLFSRRRHQPLLRLTTRRNLNLLRGLNSWDHYRLRLWTAGPAETLHSVTTVVSCSISSPHSSPLCASSFAVASRLRLRSSPCGSRSPSSNANARDLPWAAPIASSGPFFGAFGRAGRMFWSS